MNSEGYLLIVVSNPETRTEDCSAERTLSAERVTGAVLPERKIREPDEIRIPDPSGSDHVNERKINNRWLNGAPPGFFRFFAQQNSPQHLPLTGVAASLAPADAQGPPRGLP